MAGGERRLYAAVCAIPSVMLVEMVGSRKCSGKAGNRVLGGRQMSHNGD